MTRIDVREILAAIETAGGAGILEMLPGDLNIIGELITEVRMKGNSCLIIACIILSHSKKYFEQTRDGAIEWREWGQERYGCSREYIHHMRAVGDMILEFIRMQKNETCVTCNTDEETNKTCYTVTLLSLDFCKLLSLTRLPIEKTKEILDTVQLVDMSRDEVREIVSMALGEKPQEKNKGKAASQPHPYFGEMYQPALFEELVDDIASWTEDRTAEAASHANVKPGRTLRAAISLLDVDIRKLEAGQEMDEAYSPEMLIQTLTAAVNQITQLIGSKKVER